MFPISSCIICHIPCPFHIMFTFTGFVGGGIFWATGMPIGIEILQVYWRKVLEVSWNQYFRCFFKVFFSRAVFSIPISQIVLTQCWLYALRGEKCKEHLFQQFFTVSCRKRWKVFLEIFWNLKKKLTCFSFKIFSWGLLVKLRSSSSESNELWDWKNIEHQVCLFTSCHCRKNR